ncbi:hypothetical protein [Mesorhizobium sp.]|uniref:hypothetical protein n=1 Tax=Mesorhizobium sp. TaxID=1871066 RepID=UPI0025C53CD0|nr:hypothetical protein [Mesorhizobium sp.]
MRGVKAAGSAARQSWTSVAQAVWLPGVGAALSSLGYGAILSFAALLFAERGWHPVWLPFTAYAASLIAARLCFGHLPDRLGGARVAAIFVVVEAAGLLSIWLAPGPLVAAIGAGLTGLGYSLVYPGLGAEAVAHLPGGSRGLAMGLYTVFLDVALGFGSPALGLIAASAAPPLRRFCRSSDRLFGQLQCRGTSAHNRAAKPRLSSTQVSPVTTALPSRHL